MERRARARWLVVVAAVLVLSACGTSRDAGRAGTIPDITSPSTTPTSAPPTTAAPVTAAPTVAPTAAPVLATSLTTTIPPPTAAPTAPPVLATSLTTVLAPAAPTAVPPTPAPTAPPVLVTSLTTAPGPTTTTTLVVAPGEAPPCNADAIRVDTGVTIAADPVCRAGWAVFPGPSCEPGSTACPGAKVFRITDTGWQLAGTYDLSSSCRMTALGMSRTVADEFGPCTAAPPQATIIRPGRSGSEVAALQVALVGLGYPIGVDGTYGPRTEAAVRDFQGGKGLEVDGLAGPRTQFALGIGPDPDAPTPTAAPSTAAPSTAAPTTTAAPAGGSATTTTVVAGAPRACTAETVTADVGNTVTGTLSCGAGWAVEHRDCGGQACEGANVFHLTGSGWRYDGTFSSKCAEGLTAAGMTLATASGFTPVCDPSDSVVPTNILPGSSDLRVRALQIALIGLGYPLAVDAVYGPPTVAAVRDFQAADGLEVDGIAGPATQSALGI